MQYFGADGLGSVRQLYNSSGQIIANHRFDPFGNTISQSGVGTSAYGFTGEWTDATGLEYLRARYYAPVQGRFVTRDVWPGDYNAPLTLDRWNYVQANPVNATDPTGHWRWGLTASPYHEEIEDYFEGSLLGTLNPSKQLEYRIPSAGGRHPDMFNSLSGDVYEIEPIGFEADGIRQVQEYVSDLLNAARNGELKGTYFGVARYDWNRTLFHIGTGIDWPGKMRKPLFPYTDVELVADYTAQGIVVYWLERKAGVPDTQTVLVPNQKLLRPRDWTPVPVPVEAAQSVPNFGGCPVPEAWMYAKLGLDAVYRAYQIIGMHAPVRPEELPHVPPPDLRDYKGNSSVLPIIPSFIQQYGWAFAIP